jgi:hypothetical protein
MRRHPTRTARSQPKEALLRKRTPEATEGDPWERWLAESERTASEIRSRLGHDLEVDEFLTESRRDLEHRGE